MGYSQEFCCTEANNMSLLSDSIEDGVILLLTAKKKNAGALHTYFRVEYKLKSLI